MLKNKIHLLKKTLRSGVLNFKRAASPTCRNAPKAHVTRKKALYAVPRSTVGWFKKANTSQMQFNATLSMQTETYLRKTSDATDGTLLS